MSHPAEDRFRFRRRRAPGAPIGLASLEAALDRVAPGDHRRTALPAVRAQPADAARRPGRDRAPDAEIRHRRRAGSAPTARRFASAARRSASASRWASASASTTPSTRTACCTGPSSKAPRQQLALKKALLKAYFSDGENPSDPEVLVRLAGAAGLDPARARAILRERRIRRSDARARTPATPTPASTRCRRSSSTTGT